MQADPLPAEPPGKPKNTGVGSLALLQGDFPNPGIPLGSPALQVDPLPTELSGKLLEHKGDQLLSLPGEQMPGILGGNGHEAAVVCQAGDQ